MPDEELGVSHLASEAEIRAAYKKAALKWHPDHTTSVADRQLRTQKFQEMSRAYEILSDPITRKIYDACLFSSTPSKASSPSSTWTPTSERCFESAYSVIPLIIGDRFWTRFDPRGGTQCCLGDTRQGRQCRNPKRSDPGLIRELRSLDAFEDAEASCEVIRDFLYERFCYHHRDAEMHAATRWFAKQKSKAQQEAHAKTSHRTRYTSSTPPPRASTSTRSGLRSDAAASEKLRDQHMFNLHDPVWERFTTPSWVGKPLTSIIRETLLKPFANAAPGHLYAYTSASAPGFRKIGRTVRDPQARIAEWASQCKQKIQLESTTELHVRAVEQLERLVFAELHPHRFREVECPECHRKHQEWFKVSAPHARKVMAKWAAFLQTDPYAWDPVHGDWRLEDSLQDSKALHELQTPLDTDEVRSATLIAYEVKEAVAEARAGAPTVSDDDSDTESLCSKVSDESEYDTKATDFSLSEEAIQQERLSSAKEAPASEMTVPKEASSSDRKTPDHSDDHLPVIDQACASAESKESEDQTSTTTELPGLAKAPEPPCKADQPVSSGKGPKDPLQYQLVRFRDPWEDRIRLVIREELSALLLGVNALSPQLAADMGSAADYLVKVVTALRERGKDGETSRSAEVSMPSSRNVDRIMDLARSLNRKIW